jgi:hypothetical protein
LCDLIGIKGYSASKGDALNSHDVLQTLCDALRSLLRPDHDPSAAQLDPQLGEALASRADVARELALKEASVFPLERELAIADEDEIGLLFCVGRDGLR